MTEKLLQHIWQFQYFNSNQLQTVDGQKIEIIHKGNFNTNQGPDFLNAKIKIDNTILVGNIELHINSSDWLKHNHSNDKNYDNVILHVVWNNDVFLKNNFSTLVLQDRVSSILLNRYSALMQQQQFIPCEKILNTVPEITWLTWKERLLIERLQQKSEIVFAYLKQNNNHWEETFWWMIAKNFGIKVNAEAFETIAKSIPINVLAKHKNQIHQIEALLFGQAGLLNENFKEDYPSLLKREYNLLKTKFKLTEPKINLHFLRMRPANFPTIRLAQLAMLVVSSVHLFSKIKELKTVKEVKSLLQVTANDYWHYHYQFDEQSEYKPKQLGKQMIENIIINTLVPILFAYAYLHKSPALKDKILGWLTGLAAEKNNITKSFTSLNIANKAAFDSQALIQLKNEYCNKKRCLECAVGAKLLKH